MEIVLPNQFLSVMGLLRAINGSPDRDQRIIGLALGHLDPVHREHFLSRAVGENERWELEAAHRGDRAYHALTQASFEVLRVVFWKLGLIIDPGPGHKRAHRRPLIAGLMDKHLGPDPAQAEFACLACGGPVHVPVGRKGGFTCPICGHRSRLSYNDGRRVAFPTPKPVRPSPSSIREVAAPVANNERKAPAEPLGAFLKEAVRLLELPPAPPSEELTRLYHSSLAKYPVTGPKSPAAAMHEIINAMWAKIEERCRR